MKPKQYVKNYELSNKDYIPKEMVTFFCQEVIATCEMLSSSTSFNYERFKVFITEMKNKWSMISIKTNIPTEKWDKSWNYVYATVIVKLRDKFFGDYLENKKSAYEKRKKEREEERQWEWESLFSFLFATQDNSCFDKLGISSNASTIEVKQAFMRLSVSKHPDKGGDPEEFKDLVTAKNECLAKVKN